MADVKYLRRAILEASLATSNFGESPKTGELYIPPAHVKALRLESNLIVGARGVGKSFWTAALTASDLRISIESTVRELEHTDVRIGFSVKESINDYPNADTFGQLLGLHIDPYDIWRTVILRWSVSTLGEKFPGHSWQESVSWMKDNPEDTSRLIGRANAKFENESRFGLIVFDALDRTSTDWRAMDSIVRGLLRATLWLKSYPRLHAKVFLREDQFERTVTDFPDASKLLATKAELTWARHDLHGLLWQRLINAPQLYGEEFRNVYFDVTKSRPLRNNNSYELPDDAKRENSLLQRALFEQLAGQWMGRDRRRGIPYTWSVGHLADGRGQTSPRSFLAAIRQAAEDSIDRYPDYPLPIHYESIKRGIQKASEIRVNEMAEDYPWVRIFLEKLQGLNVPCEFALILERWQQFFPNGPSGASSSSLPAQHIDRGWDGIRDDLIRLGLLEQKKDFRIDMPDLYRVGFGLGRKGGVKPKN